MHDQHITGLNLKISRTENTIKMEENQEQEEGVQALAHELFRMYTDLTSLLLEYGYGYLIDFMPESDVPALIEEVTNAISKIVKLTGEKPSKSAANSNSLEKIMTQKAADLQVIFNKSKIVEKQLKKEPMHHTLGRLMHKTEKKLDKSKNELLVPQRKTAPASHKMLQSLPVNTINVDRKVLKKVVQAKVIAAVEKMQKQSENLQPAVNVEDLNLLL